MYLSSWFPCLVLFVGGVTGGVVELAVCRADCLIQTLSSSGKQDPCWNQPSCSQCWKSCEQKKKIAAMSAPTTTSSTTTISSADAIIDEQSWSKMMKVDYPSGVSGSGSWELHLVSLIHSKSLVNAQLIWEQDKGKEYLVSWELDGGGLKGHLITDTNSVSLSLWPNTLYHVQVESLSGGVSQRLELDTSEASYPLLDAPSALLSSSHSFPSTSRVLGVVVVVVGLVIVAVALLALGMWAFKRTRGRFSVGGKQLLVEDTDDVERGIWVISVHPGGPSAAMGECH